jgi:hypothetical protein
MKTPEGGLYRAFPTRFCSSGRNRFQDGRELLFALFVQLSQKGVDKDLEAGSTPKWFFHGLDITDNKSHSGFKVVPRCGPTRMAPQLTVPPKQLSPRTWMWRAASDKAPKTAETHPDVVRNVPQGGFLCSSASGLAHLNHPENGLTRH